MLMNRTIIYKLLYRATRDGNSASSFHQKYDNICGTLVVMKTIKGLDLEVILNKNGMEVVIMKKKKR